MAISPNAPDYVSQVRGILNDLRQDYINKMQLYQTEMNQREQSSAEMTRAYIQMQAQNAQNQLSRKQLDESRYINEQKIAADRQQNENDLAFKREQEYAKLQLDRQKQLKDQTAGALEQEFRVAQSSGDPRAINAVLDKIGNSMLNTAERTQLYSNVYSTLDRMKELEQTENNLKTAPIAKSFINSLDMLDPAKLTPEQATSKIDEINNKFFELSNNDPVVVKTFLESKNNAFAKIDNYRKSKIGEHIESFKTLADRNQLPPEFQSEYAELKKDPNKFTTESLAGLAYRYNEKASIAALKKFDEENVRLLEQVAKNPQMTGREFGGILPDLTPNPGYNGNIDPDTGRLTKTFLDSQKAFVDDIRKPSFILGQDLTMQQALTRSLPQMNMGIPGATGVTPKPVGPKAKNVETAAVPSIPKIQSVSKFDVAEPGTAVVQTAVKPKQTQISESTLQNIVDTYKKNPNAILYGRPVREIYAALQSRGYSMPKQAVSANVVTPGTQETGQIR